MLHNENLHNPTYKYQMTNTASLFQYFLSIYYGPYFPNFFAYKIYFLQIIST